MEKITRITSFNVDHDYIVPGMYVSRIDGDIVTYDLRTRKPNCDDFMDSTTMHSVEHMLATFARNSALSDKVIYFGPMGCRTGFYLLVRNLSEENTVALIKEVLDLSIDFEGEIPGSSKIECGNYKEHDLDGAKKEAADQKEILKNWTTADMIY